MREWLVRRGFFLRLTRRKQTLSVAYNAVLNHPDENIYVVPGITEVRSQTLRPHSVPRRGEGAVIAGKVGHFA
jgi:hypothetical protein